jgi:hypothetical protein
MPRREVYATVGSKSICRAARLSLNCISFLKCLTQSPFFGSIHLNDHAILHDDRHHSEAQPAKRIEDDGQCGIRSRILGVRIGS